MPSIQLGRRELLKGGGAIGAAGVLSTLGSILPASAADGEDESSSQAVVTRYFGILNAGMRSANGDFSTLAAVYSKNAVLTQSNPAGVTQVSRGLAAIVAWYHGTWTKIPGYQWTQESMRNLVGSVVLSYEHAGSPPLSVPGRCAHLFLVKDGLIRSLDWVTFYGGKP